MSFTRNDFAPDDEEPKILMNRAACLTDNSSWKESPAKPAEAVMEVQQTKTPSKLFLKVDSMNGERSRRAQCFLEIFAGPVPVVFYDVSDGKYRRADNLGASPTDFVLRELREILGDGAVVLQGSVRT